MAKYKKTICALSAAVALGSFMLIVQSSVATTPEKNNTIFNNSNSLFASEPNFSEKTKSDANSNELFYKMLQAVLIVVVLGVAAIYLSKKFLPKITNLPGKEIRIVETTHLGPRKSLHLIKVGTRHLLIGSTTEKITHLADVTEAINSENTLSSPGAGNK